MLIRLLIFAKDTTVCCTPSASPQANHGNSHDTDSTSVLMTHMHACGMYYDQPRVNGMLRICLRTAALLSLMWKYPTCMAAGNIRAQMISTHCICHTELRHIKARRFVCDALQLTIANHQLDEKKAALNKPFVMMLLHRKPMPSTSP